MIDELLDDGKSRMNSAITVLDDDLQGFRTGRASPRLLDKLVVEMYGVDMNVIQLASISVPEPNQLAIRPFDAASISAIERAILKSDLGLNPNNDGKMIRLIMPRLTEDRRRDLTKQVGRRVEDAKVAIRNVRRDILNDLRELKDEKMVTEDEFFKGQEDLQTMTDKHVAKAEAAGKEKSQEIMEI